MSVESESASQIFSHVVILKPIRARRCFNQISFDNVCEYAYVVVYVSVYVQVLVFAIVGAYMCICM